MKNVSDVRPLILNADVLRAAGAVMDYAMRHPLDLSKATRLMARGDGSSEHCIEIPMGFCCIFSIDQLPTDGGWVRHLSVRLREPGHIPAPEAIEILRQLFKFGQEAELIVSDRTDCSVHIIEGLAEPPPFHKGASNHE